jgi:hypothetical protein
MLLITADIFVSKLLQENTSILELLETEYECCTDHNNCYRTLCTSIADSITMTINLVFLVSCQTVATTAAECSVSEHILLTTFRISSSTAIAENSRQNDKQSIAKGCRCYLL